MSHTAPNKVSSDRIERCLEIDKINEKRNLVDEDLNFKKHASQKLKECKRKWGLITKSTNRSSTV